MSGTIIICVDGSDLAQEAAAAGLALLKPPQRAVLVTVIESTDALAGAQVSGFAGGGLSPEEFDRERETMLAAARSTVERAVEELAIGGPAETMVLEGDPGAVLCNLATELAADAMVLGSRGRGGLKRALLGSVSDHVVRNAPCPVVITNSAMD